MVDVAKLKSGGSFGELALINNDVRQATITCVTDCSFAILEKFDYYKILKRMQIKEEFIKLEFFLELPFLRYFTQNHIKNRLIKSFKVENYSMN